MIDTRRHLHKYPEVSNKEIKTIEFLSEQLAKMNVEHIVVPGGGILGFINGSNAGKTVLLRADCDALPMTESPDNLKGPKAVVSVNEGACHACGHDGHTAMLLAAGKILASNKKKINGRVILLFERGEESTGNLVFLFKYIQDNNIHIDSAYGIHLHPLLESGKIAINPGPVTAGSIWFDIKITGRGGHGSRPDESVNPIDCFNALNLAMNNIRMNRINPFRPLTFSVGYVKSGSQNNIIPDTLEFGGTVRFYHAEDGMRFLAALKNQMKTIGDAYNCEISGAFDGPTFSVINDTDCANLAKKAVSDAIGAEKVIETEPLMVSESMSNILTMWPGVFALLGIQNKEKGTGAAFHNTHFDIDEDVLKLGAASAIAYAYGFLNSDINTEPRKWKKSMADMYRYSGRSIDMVNFLEGKGTLNI